VSRPRRATTEHLSWRLMAACRGRSDLDWFSDDVWEQERCLEVCATCPVKGACLRDADRSNDVGVRGGRTEEERADGRGRRVRR
jgi:hypothetical protein